MEKPTDKVPMVIDETVNDCAVTYSTKDFSSRDTTPTPGTRSPPQETIASLQTERETTTTTAADITIALSSTLTETEKLSLPLPSNIAEEVHGNTTESISTTNTTTLSPPPTTDSTSDDQATNNNDTTTIASLLEQQEPVSVQAVDDNDDLQDTNKHLSPMDTSLPSPSIDSISYDPATSITTSHIDASSLEISAVSPSSPPSICTSTDNSALSNTTSANVETSSIGGKAKRTKRKPYQTPTTEQLESLVNGHLNDKLSISAAARRAGIARSTASSLMKKHKTQGSIPERQPRGRTAPAKIQAEQAEWIDQYLRDHESATLETIRVALLVAFPNISKISLSGLQRNITLKCTRHLKRRRQNKNGDQS